MLLIARVSVHQGQRCKKTESCASVPNSQTPIPPSPLHQPPQFSLPGTSGFPAPTQEMPEKHSQVDLILCNTLLGACYQPVFIIGILNILNKEDKIQPLSIICFCTVIFFCPGQRKTSVLLNWTRCQLLTGAGLLHPPVRYQWVSAGLLRG